MTSAPRPLLEVHDLVVSHGGRGVLAGVDLVLMPGEIAVVRGPSGSGKSTLLRAIATLVPRERGTVRLGGSLEIVRSPARYRARVAYVAQTPALFAGTVADNVRAGPRVHGGDLDDAEIAARLREVALDPALAARAATALSGGERQRVAIARALALRPDVVLFDEPTSALDAEAARTVLDCVRRSAADGRGVVVVTHHDALAAALDGTCYTCAGGRLIRGAS